MAIHINPIAGTHEVVESNNFSFIDEVVGEVEPKKCLSNSGCARNDDAALLSFAIIISFRQLLHCIRKWNKARSFKNNLILSISNALGEIQYFISCSLVKCSTREKGKKLLSLLC